MKKFFILAILLTVYTCVPAQNNASGDDLSQLKKQVNSLSANNASLNLKLKEIERNTRKLQDSLISATKDYNLKMIALQASITAREADITTARHRTDYILHSLNLRKATVYVLVPIMLILLILLYWILARKIKDASDKNEKLALNINKSLEDLIQTNKIAIQKEISVVKEDLEQKIANRL